MIDDLATGTRKQRIMTRGMEKRKEALKHGEIEEEENRNKGHGKTSKKKSNEKKKEIKSG